MNKQILLLNATKRKGHPDGKGLWVPSTVTASCGERHGVGNHKDTWDPAPFAKHVGKHSLGKKKTLVFENGTFFFPKSFPGEQFHKWGFTAEVEETKLRPFLILTRIHALIKTYFFSFVQGGNNLPQLYHSFPDWRKVIKPDLCIFSIFSFIP